MFLKSSLTVCKGPASTANYLMVSKDVASWNCAKVAAPLSVTKDMTDLLVAEVDTSPFNGLIPDV